MVRKCSVKGCNNTHLALGFCPYHYRRQPKAMESKRERQRKYARTEKGLKRKIRWNTSENGRKVKERHRNKPETRLKDKARQLSLKKEKQGKCNDCESEGKTEYHHISYEPNIAIEVCRECHIKYHYGADKE